MSSTVRETALDHISTAQPVAPLPAPEQGKALANGYGCDVFNTRVMRQRLPREVYDRLMRTMTHRTPLDPADADIIAGAMKDWALEHGATHYTHWFQPMTGLTAEKHDAFLSPTADGQVFGEFSGKMLIKGEPDASSFPSGGIRSTFEARGYTAWDPTSPVFLLGDEYGRKTLYIPTVFYSYTGEALDRKTPLMRSVEAVSAQALRILRLLGNTTATGVQAMVGSEQEYFLVDRRLYVQRPDLMMCGRTLYGAKPAKGQEMEDHYFGSIPSRVLAYMQDVEQRLFALGIPAHTRHNEVAPGQFEIAPVYEDVNIATDHNMLTMEVMRRTARRHGYVCLLHEKPFAGVNGSGKHNNWSLCDSDGHNLLNPGETPMKNAQFLVFLAAVLRAVHKHGINLRLGIIGASNDHRLGANEAPPAVLSVYLGDSLSAIIRAIAYGKEAAGGCSEPLQIGVSVLPNIPRDLSDRDDPDMSLDLYTRQCSMGITAEQLSICGATIANEGLNPNTNKQVFDKALSPKITSMIATVGFYQHTGDWLYTSGIPAKTGVGGGVMGVMPGVMGIAAFAPPLDDAGNSVKAQLAIKHIMNKLGMNVFNGHRIHVQ